MLLRLLLPTVNNDRLDIHQDCFYVFFFYFPFLFLIEVGAHRLLNRKAESGCI